MRKTIRNPLFFLFCVPCRLFFFSFFGVEQREKNQSDMSTTQKDPRITNGWGLHLIISYQRCKWNKRQRVRRHTSWTPVLFFFSSQSQFFPCNISKLHCVPLDEIFNGFLFSFTPSPYFGLMIAFAILPFLCEFRFVTERNSNSLAHTHKHVDACMPRTHPPTQTDIKCGASLPFQQKG